MSQSFFAAIKEFILGAAIFEPASVPLKEKAAMEQLLFLVLFGDKLGIPLLQPYYSLRLLPYLFPRFSPWMRSILRERDLTDIAFD